MVCVVLALQLHWVFKSLIPVFEIGLVQEMSTYVCWFSDELLKSFCFEIWFSSIRSFQKAEIEVTNYQERLVFRSASSYRDSTCPSLSLSLCDQKVSNSNNLLYFAATCTLIFVTGYLWPDTCYLILATKYLLLNACYSILVTQYVLFDTYYSIHVILYLLLDTC